MLRRTPWTSQRASSTCTGSNPRTGEIHNRKLSRAKFSAFIAQRQPGRIVMEACGNATEGRTFGAGPPGRLLPAFEVHKRVIGNKDDCADAAAIWLTAQSAAVQRACRSNRPAASRPDGASSPLSTGARAHRARQRAAQAALRVRGGHAKGRRLGLRWLADNRAQIEQRCPSGCSAWCSCNSTRCSSMKHRGAGAGSGW